MKLKPLSWASIVMMITLQPQEESSKYQAHRRAVEARPQKSRSSTAALLYMSMHLLSQMELRSINISITCCHGDEHTSKV
jgi:hypothetical protein